MYQYATTTSIEAKPCGRSRTGMAMMYLHELDQLCKGLLRVWGELVLYLRRQTALDITRTLVEIVAQLTIAHDAEEVY